MCIIEDLAKYLLEDLNDNMLKRLPVEMVLKIIQIKIQLEKFDKWIDDKYEREILEKIKAEEDKFSGDLNFILYKCQLETQYLSLCSNVSFALMPTFSFF